MPYTLQTLSDPLKKVHFLHYLLTNDISKCKALEDFLGLCLYSVSEKIKL